jgi:surface polysaccharide O-acyltransferase-like enzyme
MEGRQIQNAVNKSRYAFIDLLKAIAILFVVMYHCNNLRINIVENQGVLTYLNYFSTSILSVCVPVFFFINGALLFNKELDIKSHFIKIIHIVILVIIWGIITLLILMPIHNEYMSLFEFIKSIWKVKLNWNDHLWFLQALVVLYVFYPLLKTAYDKEMKYLQFFLGIALFMTFGNTFLSNAFHVLGIFTGKSILMGNHNYFGDFNAFRGIYGYTFIYFILGGYFLKYKEKFQDKKWVRIAAFAMAIATILLTLYGILMSNYQGETYDLVWNGYDTIPTLVMVISIFILSLRYKASYLGSELIRGVGNNSLGIYFVHRIWGSILLKYFIEIPYSNSLITNLIFTIVLTLISLFTVLFLKRIPIVKRLFVL